MNSNHSTTDATPETILSNEFGTFSPPDSTPPEVNPSEFLAMAGGVVRGQWLIPPGEFAELPQRLIEISKGSNTRTALKAMKLLLDMNQQNGPAEQNDRYGDVTIFIPDNGRGPKPGEFSPFESGGVVFAPVSK